MGLNTISAKGGSENNVALLRCMKRPSIEEDGDTNKALSGKDRGNILSLLHEGQPRTMMESA